MSRSPPPCAVARQAHHRRWLPFSASEREALVAAGAAGARCRAVHYDLTDARHLLTFMAEHPGKARQALIVCRCPRPMRLHERVVALPWFCL
ncbi:MAG TPA: hypothetical protein VF524_09295 [Polyangia bacterium]